MYRAYVARDPYSDHAPDLDMAAIEAYGKGGFSQLVLDGKHEFVEHYNFDSPVLEDAQPGRQPAGGRGAEDQPEGRRYLLPRHRAEVQARRQTTRRRRAGTAII